MKKKVFLVKSERINPEKEFVFKKFFPLIGENFEIVENIIDAQEIHVLGGDGAILTTVRKYYQHKLPFVGYNFGTEGFLLNNPTKKALREIVKNKSKTIKVRLLQAELFDDTGEKIGTEIAFNDFYFYRASKNSVRFNIWVNGDRLFKKFSYLSGDGLIVCTPAGSTAYNASAGGQILTVGTNNLILTGISPGIKYRWRTSSLSENSVLVIDVVKNDFRPASFVADGQEITGVQTAMISYSDHFANIIFADSQDYAKKVRALQFP